MKLVTTISAIILCLTVSTFFLADAHALSKLGKQIQKELDVNPFLKKEGVKLRVIEEEAGYVTIEMYEGSREVREKVNDDVDSLMSWANRKASDADKKVVFVIAKALTVIDEIDGVKDIMLTAVTNTPADLEELSDEINEWYKSGMMLFENQSYAFAEAYFRKAAERGHALAQRQLALMYAEGKGFDKDPYKAFEWLLKSAEQGDAISIAQVGYRYEMGIGTEQNYDKAFEWLNKAAELGNPPGMIRLGSMYFYGKGIEQNGKKGFEWFEKAAELGNGYSQGSLGVCYSEGIGVKQDYTKAIEWLNKAINQNNSGVTQYANAVLAWIFATSKDDKFLDGQKALEYASKIGTDKPSSRDLLATAASYARNGRFLTAIQFQKDAINSLKDYQKPRYENKFNHILELYKNNQPYTEEFKFN